MQTTEPEPNQIVGIYCFDVPSQHGCTIRLTAVLVQRVECMKAYLGYGDAEWVRDHGTKIPWSQALAYWPGITSLRTVMQEDD